MASWDDGWGWDRIAEGLEGTGHSKSDFYEIILDDRRDPLAHDMFMSAAFDKDDRAYIDLVEHMWNEYGIDFDEVFDWEDYREYYEGG